MIRILTVISLLIVLASCGSGKSGDNNIPQVVTRGTLDSSILLATNSPSFLFPYPVDAYRIIYTTIDANNKLIKASGLLSIPRKNAGEKSPLASYQHATIFLDSQSPSNSSISADPIMKLAGTGYIVSAPDFIGYGESTGIIHPFLHANSLASASLDMLRASIQFLQSKSISTNGQLFLSGYSEGGYATIALQKVIQEQEQSEFTVTASAAGASPLDLTTTSKIILNRTTNDNVAYMSFLLKAYDSIYALNQVTKMYQPQYVNTINTFFDSTHSSSAINNNLTEITADLFDSSFLDSLLNGSNNQAGEAIKEKLALNNLYDWKPNAPTRFYHGPSDDTVPYTNSQKAFDTMNANGAPNVSLRDCPLNDHVLCAVPYILDTLNFFNAYVSDL